MSNSSIKVPKCLFPDHYSYSCESCWSAGMSLEVSCCLPGFYIRHQKSSSKPVNCSCSLSIYPKSLSISGPLQYTQSKSQYCDGKHRFSERRRAIVTSGELVTLSGQSRLRVSMVEIVDTRTQKIQSVPCHAPVTLLTTPYQTLPSPPS